MTEEEKRELETLREEKRQQLQQARAREALETAGVPMAFAALLAGKDDGDTDRIFAWPIRRRCRRMCASVCRSRHLW